MPVEPLDPPKLSKTNLVNKVKIFLAKFFKK